MNTLIVLLLILVMVAFNALYVAAEFATVGSRRSRIQETAEGGSGPAQSLLSILQDPKRLDNYVAACQIGITLSSLVAGAYGQAQLIPLFEEWFGGSSRTLAIIVVLLLITGLQVVLGELLPKTVALRYPEALAIATLTPMRISQWVLRPLVAVFNGSAFRIMKALGLNIDHSHSHVHSPTELAGLYSESAAGGLIDSAEREMLAGAIAVTDRVAREVMTPRRRLITIEASTLIAEALTELSASPYSRFPVTDGGEEVIGIVTLRDLFLANEESAAVTVADVATDPIIVSEVFAVPPLLNMFSQQRVHVAMVVNEYGSISGMVTREDAIEEVFGEFNDEFDVEQDPITVTGSTVSVRGDVLLQILNERFGLSLPVDGVDTVSGYVWHHLRRLPVVGDTVPLVGAADPGADDADGARPQLQVDSVDGTLVDRASFTLPDGTNGDADEASFMIGLLAVDIVTGVVLPIVAVIALVLINGVFVAAEFALVAGRRSRIHDLAEGGNRGARGCLASWTDQTAKTATSPWPSSVSRWPRSALACTASPPSPTGCTTRSSRSDCPKERPTPSGSSWHSASSPTSTWYSER